MLHLWILAQVRWLKIPSVGEHLRESHTEMQGLLNEPARLALNHSMHANTKWTNTLFFDSHSHHTVAPQLLHLGEPNEQACVVVVNPLYPLECRSHLQIPV